MTETTIQMSAAAYAKYGVWEQGRTTTETNDTFRKLGGTACRIVPNNPGPNCTSVTVTVAGTDEAIAYIADVIAANER